jgi:tetratricopeptide (TPR) repeat protein
VSPNDVELSEHELSVERAEIDSLGGGHAHVHVNGQVQQSGQPQPNHVEGTSDPVSEYREGVTLKESGEYRKAIRLFDKLSKQDSWAVRALSQKGLCLKAIGRHDDALTAIQEASKRPPATQDESLAVQYLLARTLESQGRYDEAREIYEVLDQGQHQYRDVAARLARLQHDDQDFGLIETKPVTRFASIWRSCGQLLRNLQITKSQ